MSYAMTGHISIVIILLTIKIIIISLKAKTAEANNNNNISNISNISVGNELYSDLGTVIEFLKELQQHTQTTYDNILIMQNQNATISNVFFSNLKEISTEHRITSHHGQGLSIRHEMAATTFAKQLMATLQVPVVQLNELQSFYLKRHYCEHFLSIVYIDINIEGIQMTLNDHQGLLQKLSQNLLHMTTSKVMFLLNFALTLSDDPNGSSGADADAAAYYASATLDEDVIRGVVMQLFQQCWQQKIINVVALLADYQSTHKFYSYTHFPEFQLEIKTISFSTAAQVEQIYPNRLSNLNGFKLPIIIGGSDPRIIPYTNSKGKEIIGGFVGHFIQAFAKKYNCKLIQPIPFDHKEPMPSQLILKAVRNGTVEISAALTFPDIPFHGYSYTYEQVNWCVMLPVEANIPGYKYFTSVFKGEAYVVVIAVVIITSMILSVALYIHGFRIDLLDIICHDNCLRGILGQSFSEIVNPPRIIQFIYMQICFLGILLTTTYNSYFSTYVTRPPKEPMLKTFDDILKSSLKIEAWLPEYNELLGRIKEYQKYSSIFYLVTDYHEHLEIRDSFNTKYGYMMPTTKLIIIQEQQKMFTTPLFRQSKDLCLFNNIPMCFPIQDNSIYNSMIYRLILETAQSGLQFFWAEYGFLELITAKKLILKDLSAKQEFQAMSIDDLQYIMIFMGGMYIFVTLIFIGELLVFYRRRIICGVKRFSRSVMGRRQEKFKK